MARTGPGHCPTTGEAVTQPSAQISSHAHRGGVGTKTEPSQILLGIFSFLGMKDNYPHF